MPIGDNDIASGVFFSDFGVPVTFNGTTAAGLLDQRSEDAGFGGQAKVSNTDYRLEISATAFAPMPTRDTRLTVDGVAYVVRSVDPLDDGATVEIQLRKS